MAPRVLVAGVGNVLLGDDGFGPEVVRQLAEQELPPDVRVADYGIRGLHLAYDLLDAYDALILVDALPGGGRPGEVVLLKVNADDRNSREFDAHGMDPAAMLAHLEQLGGKLPMTYLVGCRAATTAEWIGLSPSVTAAIPEAIAAVRSVLSRLG
ncbi:hydrogenase maturation protease [Paractinoplanes atraurantiacus]|uniref:Hydrogenase maturation protease n=1 Tax=Paractinoplanes atraurantiacus TaxID=1036182 RepID=A0A285J3N2_9ACTN|nr:hydrogenase maturation protease [Actinoplanes atraurantiacus]SNY54802.1 hydrogenase maturation protease [Actinoplanes atraurantiacus]